MAAGKREPPESEKIWHPVFDHGDLDRPEPQYEGVERPPDPFKPGFDHRTYEWKGKRKGK